jgi:sugar phosphate permease
MSTDTNTPNTNQSLITALAMLGGLGITLMVGAAAIGSVDANANSTAIGLALLTGLLCLLGAIATWFAVVQPHKHFDDINVAQYHGHEHHDTHADDHATGQAQTEHH